MTSPSEPGKVQVLVDAALANVDHENGELYDPEAIDRLYDAANAFSSQEIAAADFAIRGLADISQEEQEGLPPGLQATLTAMAYKQRVQALEAERDSLRDRLEAELLSVYRQRDRLREAIEQVRIIAQSTIAAEALRQSRTPGLSRILALTTDTLAATQAEASEKERE